MTQQQFVSIVRGCEYDAKQNPPWYRFRVLLLMGLAYAYIALLFVVSLGLLAGTIVGLIIVIKSHAAFNSLRLLVPVAFGSVTFAGFILRSLSVKLPEPEGVPLVRDQAVPLFQEIDRIKTAMRVPSFDQVLLTNELNAAVIQTPRLGLLGWQKNTLILGIPLMLVLSPDQFRAALAHEMGHIGGSHSVMGTWAYRMEQTWHGLLLSLLHEEHVGSLPLVWFFRWYSPYFDAFTFALRRQDEFDADAAAAKTVGAQTLAECLLRLALTHRAFREPAENLPVPRQTVVRWLNEVTVDAPQHDVDDTHPPLAARLRAIGQKAFVPEPFEQSAAERYFGHQLPRLAQSVGITLSDAPPTTTR